MSMDMERTVVLRPVAVVNPHYLDKQAIEQLKLSGYVVITLCQSGFAGQPPLEIRGELRAVTAKEPRSLRQPAPADDAPPVRAD